MFNLLKEKAALGYRVEGSDGGEGCGSICKASLLTLAGFGTLAVYNGLGVGRTECAKF